MKKKLFILVPVFALIICALTPLTAFAVVQPTGKTAYTVAKDYGLTKGHDVVFKSGDDYYILCCPSSVTFGSVNSILYGKVNSDINYYVYKFDSNNVYKKPVQSNMGYIQSKDGLKNIKSFNSIMYSTVNIYNVTDSNGTLSLENSVFFQGGDRETGKPGDPGTETEFKSLVLDYLQDIKSGIDGSSSYLAGIASGILDILSNTQGLDIHFNNVEKLLGDIKQYVNDFHADFLDFRDQMYTWYLIIVEALYVDESDVDGFQGLKTIYAYVHHIDDNINLMWNRLIAYFPAAGELYNGWQSFFKSFKDMSFQNVLIDIHTQIEDSVNPVSENNKPQFDALVNSFKSDTAVGSMITLKDSTKTMFDSVTSAEPKASINVNTFDVNFCGMKIPSYTIKIDFSWYERIRKEALYLWRFFLWSSYLFILWKRIPDIINGAGVITDMSNDDITSGAAESISYTTTVDDNGEVISMNERHTYNDINGNKFTTNIKHDVGR